MWQDLTKIIVDKLCIGLLLAWAAYLFSRGFEHFKANTAYFQKLGEARIEAFKEIAAIVRDRLFKLHSLLAALSVATNATPRHNRQVIQQSIDEAYSKFADSHQEQQPRLLELGIFITQNTHQPLGEHFTLMHDLIDRVQPPFDLDNLPDLSPLLEKLKVNLGKIEGMVIREMNSPPFPSKPLFARIFRRNKFTQPKASAPSAIHSGSPNSPQQQ